MSKGSVYIATNAFLPDLVKIGRSSDPAARMIELSGASGVPGRFELAHAVEVADMRAVEIAMHRRFAARRVAGSEFFRMGVGEAKAALNRTALWSSPRLRVFALPLAAPTRLARLAAASLLLAALAAAFGQDISEPRAKVLLAVSALVVAASATGGPPRPAKRPAGKRSGKARPAARVRWTGRERLSLVLGVTIALGVFGHQHGLV